MFQMLSILVILTALFVETSHVLGLTTGVTPTGITCPANKKVEVESDISTDALGHANAGPDTTVSHADVKVTNAKGGHDITRTFTATNAAGDTATCVQIIKTEDTTPPELTCPQDVTVRFGADTSVSILGSAVASDNHDVHPDVCHTDITNSISNGEENIIRTFAATDATGNSAICVQDIKKKTCGTLGLALPLPIPDSCNAWCNCVEHSIPKSGSCAPSEKIADLTVCVTITHTWAADLMFRLIHEETGTIVVLVSDTFAGTGTNIYNNTCFNNAGANGSINKYIYPSTTLTGTYIPPETLGAFKGEHPDGTWTLNIVDNFERDTGALQAWDIQFVCADFTAPKITCPFHKTVNMGSDMSTNSLGNALALDIYDPSPTVTHTDLHNSNSNGGETVTRTFTAINAAGNTATCAQTIIRKETCWKLLTIGGDSNIYEVNTTSGETHRVFKCSKYSYSMITYNPDDGKLYCLSGNPGSTTVLKKLEPHTLKHTDLIIGETIINKFTTGFLSGMTYDTVRKAFLFYEDDRESIYQINTDGKTNETRLSSASSGTSAIVRKGDLIYTTPGAGCSSYPCIRFHDASTLETINEIHLSPSDNRIFHGLAIHPETNEMFGNFREWKNDQKDDLSKINLQSLTTTAITKYNFEVGGLTFIPCSFLQSKST